MRRLRVFLSHWQNWVGLLIVLSFAVVTFTAPLLSPPNDTTQGAFKKVGRATDLTPHPPSAESILGTLPGQIDVYHALIWGSREAMIFGLSVALGAFLFGSLFGAIAGYAGGAVNRVLMRIADAFLTFPVLAGVVFLQQLVVMTVEAQGGAYWFNRDFFGRLVFFEFTPPPFAAFLMKVDPILLCLIIFSWMPFARVVNTMVITLKGTDFIQAARALGGSPLWVIRKHLLPNAISPAIVLAARDVGSSVIMQATITFIGLGGTSAWGILLSLGRNWVIGPGGNLLSTWWVYLPITLAIVLFGVGWNLIGDGLAEALDPTATIFRRMQPDDAVVLERIEYKEKPVKTSPDWDKSLGIGSGATAATTEPEVPLPGVPGPNLESKESGQPESAAIPDWMRESSWGESTGAFDEPAASISQETSEETPDGELARADLPDWIKSMAPKETELFSADAGVSSTPESSPIDDETLEWLNRLSGDKPFGPVPAPGAQDEAFEGTLKAAQPDEDPNWLSNLETPSRDSISPASGESPDWLSQMEESGQTSPASPAASKADWLFSKPDNEEAPISKYKEEVSPVTDPVSPILPAADAGIGSRGISTAEQDAVRLWLESLAAKQEAKSEELIFKPEDLLEKPHKLVEPTREVPESQPVSQIPEQSAPTAESDRDNAELTKTTPSEVPEIDRTGIWLSELEEKESGLEKTFDVDSAARLGEIVITPPSPVPSAEDGTEEDIPLSIRDTNEKLVSPATGFQGDMPDWMTEGVREEPAVPEPTQPADWLPEAEIATPAALPETPKPAVLKQEPKPQPKSEQKFKLKFELKPEPVVEPKSEAKPQPKSQVITEPKPQIKPLAKPAAAIKEDITKIRRNGSSPSMIDPTLASARDAMSRGKIPDALQVYGNLIRKGKLLEDITFDLKEALYRFPVEVSIWEMLGDAYMRSNRMQDALDAYSKAEELLR